MIKVYSDPRYYPRYSLKFTLTPDITDYVSEAIQMLRSTDTKLFKSHNKGRVVYGFNHGKIVILESHYKVLAFEQVE